jgi:hypothetical protein
MVGALKPRKKWKNVTPPTGWGWALPFTVQRKGSKFRAKGFDITAYKPAVLKTYYVSPTGNDTTGNGLAWATAYRSINKAITQADADLVYVETGTYTRSFSWDGNTLSRSMSIIGVGGYAICALAQTAADGLTWSLTADQTNTYQCTRSSASKVLDVSVVAANGDYQELTLRSSIATVEANAGSYWINGTTVYAHTTDHRQPDANVWVTLTTRNGKINGDVHVYAENIDFVGGYAGLEFDNTGAGQTGELYLKSCKFRHATGNGLESTGQSLVIAQDCLAARNGGDGFNYHYLNSVVPKIIEINNVGRDNGSAGDDDNGSTSHDGASIVRIMGEYMRNKGPNVIDSASLESLNLGVKSYTSAASISGARADFDLGGGSGTMWCDTCNNDESTSEHGFRAGTGTTVKKHNCRATVADDGSGTVESY